MGGRLLSFVTLLAGIAMVAYGGFVMTTGGIAIRTLGIWLVLRGIFTLMAGYLNIRVVLWEFDIKKRQDKFLPQTDIRTKQKAFWPTGISDFRKALLYKLKLKEPSQ
jgi:hypothetical protein